MKYRDAERGAHDGAPTESLSAALTADKPHVSRFAEDGIEQLHEVDVWLDSLDVVLLDALGGGSWSKAEVCEYVLCGHGKIRRHLGAAVVGAVA